MTEAITQHTNVRSATAQAIAPLASEQEDIMKSSNIRSGKSITIDPQRCRTRFWQVSGAFRLQLWIYPDNSVRRPESF